MNGSHALVAALVLSSLIGAACWMRAPAASVDRQPEAAAVVDDAAVVVAVVQLDRNDSAIIQGRLGIGSSGKPADAFVDIEVQGPRKRAMAICDALLRADASMVMPDGSDLAAHVVRPCSGEAMGEPEATTRFAMVQVQHFDSVELMLRVAEVSKEELQTMRVRRRFLSGHKDESTCQASLARVQESEQKAAMQAEQAGKKWLEGALADEKKSEAQACKGAKPSKSCEQARLIVKLLQERQTRPSTEQSLPIGNRTAVCRLR
jgi:hypothetical protein